MYLRYSYSTVCRLNSALLIKYSLFCSSFGLLNGAISLVTDITIRHFILQENLLVEKLDIFSD